MKTVLNTLKENIKYLSLIILGITLIWIVIYFRLIYVRLPKKLNFVLFENYTIKYNVSIIIFIILLTIISLTVIYINSRVLREKPFEIKDNKLTNLFIKSIIKIYSIISSSLYAVHSFIVTKIPNGFDHIGNLIMKFYYSPISKCKYILLFQYSIRLIICLSFLIDILVFFKLNYFYKSLSLMILIIMLKLWIFNMKDWVSNIDLVKSYLIIESKNIGTEFEEHSFAFSPEYINQNLDLAYYVEMYCNLLTISEYIDLLESYTSYYNLRFNTIYYSLMLFGCFYVLEMNLY